MQQQIRNQYTTARNYYHTDICVVTEYINSNRAEINYSNFKIFLQQYVHTKLESKFLTGQAEYVGSCNAMNSWSSGVLKVGPSPFLSTSCPHTTGKTFSEKSTVFETLE